MGILEGKNPINIESCEPKRILKSGHKNKLFLTESCPKQKSKGKTLQKFETCLLVLALNLIYVLAWPYGSDMNTQANAHLNNGVISTVFN